MNSTPVGLVKGDLHVVISPDVTSLLQLLVYKLTPQSGQSSSSVRAVLLLSPGSPPPLLGSAEQQQSACKMFGTVQQHRRASSPSCDLCLGFLQKNNSLEDQGRAVGSFSPRKQRPPCGHSGRDGRCRRSETDFSNLFARGRNTHTAPGK